MATSFPTKKGKTKGKAPVSAKQAAGLANFLKGKQAPAKMPMKPMMDPEDMIDGGVDEKTEKN